ncbi:MAG: ABC transporter permease [Candidatus Aminicenantes bacterium]|nr:ABC transporter permease [Candidatus Aminicenantes bacterium]
MFRNNFRVALRNLLKHKGFSAINIAGLALGLAAGFFVLIFIRDETSYDRFHEKADRIYRVAQYIHIENRVDSALPTPPILAAALAEEFPEVEATARVAQIGGIVSYEDQRFVSPHVYAVDADFFKVFSFRLATGDAKTALTEPNRVILTRSAARRVFGDKDPLGRVLTIGQYTFTVTGIAEDCPRNSHFHFEYLTSIPTYPLSRVTGWFEGSCATYVVLKKGTSPQALEAKLPEFVLNHHYGGKKGGSIFKDWVYFLQPLASIHLHSHLLIGEFEANSSAAYITIFFVIAVFVLLVAAVNFVNLSTARSAVRSREVGIRKVCGSDRARLVRQFLGESVLMTAAAFAIALALIVALMPAFRNLTGKAIGLVDLAIPAVVLSLALLALLVGVGAGIYPALVLSSFRPAAVLRGTFAAATGFRSSALRKGLIVLQFAVSIFLLVGTAVVYKQTDYFQSKRLGFDREHVLVVKRAGLLGQNVRAFKAKLLQHPDIKTVALSSNLPGGGHNSLQVLRPEGSQEGAVMEMLTCDEDFQEALRLEMAAGRFFSPDHPSDDQAIIINEVAARDFGWDKPLGKTFAYRGGVQVIGVVRDFHVHSLHAKIPRMGFLYAGGARERNGDYFAVRVRPADIRKIVSYVRTAWDSFSPPLPLDYSFLDEDYTALYVAETRTMKVLGVFSGLAIAISCLGLYGLVSFMTERRRKEIGIRKVLGARVEAIVVLLGRDFLRWVLLANLVAWPAAFYVTRRWLQNFAYRIDIGVWPFVLSTGAVLVVAAVTLSYQTVAAALANPADSLRRE